MSADDAEALPEFRDALLAWYGQVARPMPWRNSADPYRIWLSEIMLQQTRVDQVLPYFERFVAAFPDLPALASAPLDEVLRHWEGLGYYSRARNLHAASRAMAEHHAGRIPSTYEAIVALPGIGPYTAAAVLSIAYGRPHAAVDGNVIRVLSRLFVVTDDVGAGRTRAHLQRLADTLIDPRRPGDYNQALMELGATVCIPRSPRCGACPIALWCRACAEGTQENFPVKTKKGPTPHYHHVVGIVRNEAGEYLIHQRHEENMLGGMWTFPGGRLEAGESVEAACRRLLLEDFDIDALAESPFHRLSHAYSHFKITLNACDCQNARPRDTPGDRRLKWVAAEALTEHAFDRASRKLIDAIRLRDAS
ncbi:MAG: A/G-specific adenine glycosylase [Rhodothermales bacterium]|nr:A/G-specific adenine glycosylase [Rhodothermales bacterium]